MQSLGTVTLKYKGTDTSASLNDDGTITLMPSGKRVKINNEQWNQLKLQLDMKNAPPQTQMDVYNGMQTERIDAFQKYDDTAERAYNRKQRVKIVLTILFAILLVAACVFLLYTKKPELLGLAPNSYKVVVANTEIPEGSVIEDAALSYIELSRDEYSAQCADMYLASDGSMKTDKPIFFVNANNQLVGKFASKTIKEGEIIKESMATTQKYSGEVTIDGEKTTVDMTESQLNGETTVEIIARVKSTNGVEQEIPLTTMKLQGKSLSQLLDGQGTSLIDKMSSASDTSSTQEVTPDSEPQEDTTNEPQE